jgi:hypothetical protein
MFVTEGVESSATTNLGATFYGKNDFAFEFANNLQASFAMTLKSQANYDNFSSLLITVTDAYDADCYLTFETTAIDNAKSKLVVNGSSVFTMVGSMKNFGSGFVLTFNNNTLKLSDASAAVILALKSTAIGEPFAGFVSGFVSVKVEVKGVTAQTAVAVNAFNAHSFTEENRYDMISPYIVPAQELSLKNSRNSTITVPKALAYDVVDPDVYAGITVYAPNGDVVTATDGTFLFEAPADKDYQIVLTSLGEYTLQYFASDVSDNSFDYGYYTIFAVDTTAPVITMKSYLKSEVKVGDELTIPEFSYSDDSSKTEDIKVMITVTLPQEMSYQIVEMGQKFKFEQKGVYYVRFTVVDDFFNFTTVEQIVVCK